MRKKALALSVLFTLAWAFFILSVHMGIGWAIIAADKIEYVIDFGHLGIQLIPIGYSAPLTYIFAISSVFCAFCFMYFLLQVS